MSDDARDYFLDSVLDSLNGIPISGCVLRPHPSTPYQLTYSAKTAIEMKTRVMLWNQFSQDLADGDLVEPASLSFGYALFTCQTSAIHYTRVFSPNTRVLYAYDLHD